MELESTRGLIASGWWTYRRKKVRASKADLWAFVLDSFETKKPRYIFIAPKGLDRRVRAIPWKVRPGTILLFVTKEGRCWDTRGLPKTERILIANDAYDNKKRDFTQYLDSWKELKRRL